MQRWIDRTHTKQCTYKHIIILSERRHHRIVPNPTCRRRRCRGFRAVRTVIIWESRVENKTPTTARLSVGLPQNTRLLYTFIYNKICTHTPLWHGTYHYYYFNRYLCTRVIDKISCHNTCAIYIAVMRGSEYCYIIYCSKNVAGMKLNIVNQPPRRTLQKTNINHR